jgi:Holliday junction resolvase RusA-like endonuclease
VIVFEVLGTPAPKGSARAFYKAGMKRAVIVKDNSERQRGWEGAVREAALAAIGERVEPVYVQRPVSVTLEFRLTRPAGHWGTKGLKPSAPAAPASKPDADKLARTTLDALTGLAFDDDARIVCLVVTKVYAAAGREGARITVEEWRPG